MLLGTLFTKLSAPVTALLSFFIVLSVNVDIIGSVTLRLIGSVTVLFGLIDHNHFVSSVNVDMFDQVLLHSLVLFQFYLGLLIITT